MKFQKLSATLLCQFIFIIKLSLIGGELSDLRLCGDPECKVPVSTALTVQRYDSVDEDIMSLPTNTRVKIFSKSAGTKKKLWGVEVNGKRGYAPSKFLREDKIIIKDLKYIVPVVSKNAQKSSTKDDNQNKDKDNKDKDTTENPSTVVTSSTLVLGGEDAEYENMNVIIPTNNDKQEELLNSTTESIEPDKVINVADKTEHNNVNNEDAKSNDDGSEDSPTDGITEDSPTDGITEDRPTDKVIEDSSTDEVIEDSSTDEEIEDSSTDEEIEDSSTDEEIEDSSTDEEIEDSSTDEGMADTDDIDDGTEDTDPDDGTEDTDPDDGTEDNDYGEEEEYDEVEENQEHIEINQSKSQNKTKKEKETLNENNLDKTDDKANNEIDKSDKDKNTLKSEFVTATVVNNNVQTIVSASDASSPTEGPPSISPHESSDTFEVFEGTTIYNSDSGPSISDVTEEPSPYILQASEVDIPTSTPLSIVESSEIDVQSILQNNEQNVPTDSLDNIEPIVPTDSLDNSEPIVTTELISGEENQEISIDEVTIDPTKTVSENGSWISNIANIASWFSEDEGPKSQNITSDEVLTLDQGDDLKSTIIEQSSGDKPTDIDDGSDTSKEILENDSSPIEDVSNFVTDNIPYAEIPDSTDDIIKPPELDQNDNSEHITENIQVTNDSISEPEIEHVQENIEPESGQFLSMFSSSVTEKSAGNHDDATNVLNINIDSKEIPTDLPNEEILNESNNELSNSESDSKDETTSNDNEQIQISDSNDVADLAEQETVEKEIVDSPTEVNSMEQLFTDDNIEKSAEVLTSKEPEILVEMVTTTDKDQTSDISSQNIPFSDIEKLQDTNEEEETVEEDVKNGDEPSFTEGLLQASHSIFGDNLALAVEAELANPHMSTGAATLLVILAVSIIALYFLHLVFAKMSKEAPLLEAMNQIEHAYRVALTELMTLKEQTPLNVMVTSNDNQDKITTKQNQELNDQLQKLEIESSTEHENLMGKINQLEQDLVESTNNGIEMHNMLEELLASQKESSAFQASVDDLQTMLDNHKEVVGSLTSDLTIKNRLNDELQLELINGKDKTTKLEYQIEQFSHLLEDGNKNKVDIALKLEDSNSTIIQLQQTNTELTNHTDLTTSQVDSLSQQVDQLTEAIQTQNEALQTRDAELSVSRECIKQLKCLEDNGTQLNKEKISEVFNIIKIKSQLQKAKSDRLRLSNEVKEKEASLTKLEKELVKTTGEVEDIKEVMTTAVTESQEAKGRLEVLTVYFKEKEADLTKELESKEGLRLDAEGSAENITKRIQGFKLEVSTYKTKISSLETELIEQEQSLKQQITNHEKKVHEGWLIARAGERKHEELSQENSQLRQRLNNMHKEKEEQQQQQRQSLFKPTPKRAATNGSTVSPVLGHDNEVEDLITPPHMPPMPPFMLPPPGMMPPPPGMMPPPPPFMPPMALMGDRRMPPAGRMASPPFRWQRSPPLDSPLSDSHYSDNQRYSPDRRPNHLMRRSSPPPSMHRSPDRWYNRSPEYAYPQRPRSPPRGYCGNPEDSHSNRAHLPPPRGKKTSTPLGPNER